MMMPLEITMHQLMVNETARREIYPCTRLAEANPYSVIGHTRISLQAEEVQFLLLSCILPLRPYRTPLTIHRLLV